MNERMVFSPIPTPSHTARRTRDPTQKLKRKIKIFPGSRRDDGGGDRTRLATRRRTLPVFLFSLFNFESDLAAKKSSRSAQVLILKIKIKNQTWKSCWGGSGGAVPWDR